MDKNTNNLLNTFKEISSLSKKINGFDSSLFFSNLKELLKSKNISSNEAMSMIKKMQSEIKQLKDEVTDIKIKGIKWKRKYKLVKKDRDELVELHRERTKRFEKGIVSSVKFDSKTLQVKEILEYDLNNKEKPTTNNKKRSL